MPASLPELVERLQSGGPESAAEFSEEELESVIDDLPLALESEAIREALPALVARIVFRQERTFRRIIEIARQDEERTPLLLSALRALEWTGTPTEDEFAWLITQMTKHPLPVARMDAYRRAAALTLHQAQVSILDAMAQIHPDEAIRRALEERHEAGEGEDAPETTGEMVLATERRASEEPEAPAPPPEEAPPQDVDWSEEKAPDKFTVRTLLRSLDPPINLGGEKPVPDDVPEVAPEEEPDEETIPEPDPEPAAAQDEDVSGFEPTPPPEEQPPPAEIAADGGSAPAPSVEEEFPTDEPTEDRVTVRTLLRSLDTVRVELPPAVPPDADQPAVAPPADVPPPQFVEVGAENAPDVDDREDPVKSMLRSLDTVRLSLKELEASAPPPEPAQPVADLGPKRTDKPAAGPPPPWLDPAADLTNQSPPERARRLTKVRRELKTPELRRGYLQWLLKNEDDASFGPSIRKELIEYAFERPTFLTWDGATRQRLGRWIREKAAAELIPAAAVLAALRRAAWVDGEPPHFDNDTRPLVDAASGCLVRAPSEERLKLLGRDFSVWLFGVREFEDKEVLDRWAGDEMPGVAEGLFRALAAMDALAARVGGTGDGPTALALALGVWDRAHSDTRLEMAKAIAAGWSRSFVLDRANFFKAFWKRHQEHENQREAIMIVLATTFEKELDNAQRATKEVSGEKPAARPATPPPPIVKSEPGPAASAIAAPAPPQAAPGESPFAEGAGPGEEDSTARYFRAKREEIERSMRGKPVTPAPIVQPTPPVPEKPPLSTSVAAPPSDESSLPDEITEDLVPDEGEGIFDEEGLDEEEKLARRRARTDPKIRLPAKTPQPIGPETEVVLPHEPLRTLADYTTFLRALSAGTPIDELLERHGMDYKQYAACMTAWGKVLQNRPELALRMGQLLRV